MGVFDFLHGVQNQKSEAELYMEQRNKEYARKAAAYRRKETLSVSIPNDSFLGKLFSGDTYAKPNQRRTINNAQLQQTRQSTNTYCKPQTQYNKKSDCDTCGTNKSIYDTPNLDIFTVENAFAKSADRTVVASGQIVRGGFSVGDKVIVKTTLEERVVPIQKIFRQGELISYANMSSGKVAIVLSNAADIMVRKGDTLTKKK